MSTVVGGSAIVAFPALLALGYAPVVAIGTYATAMFPAGLMSAYADRANAPRFDRTFWWHSLMALAGGGIGAVLLIRTPNQVLEKAAPLLIIFATITFAFAPKLGVAFRHSKHGLDSSTFYVVSFFIYLYGGYFGAGIGIIMLALYSTIGLDLRRAAVLKNVMTSLNTIVAILVFASSGSVAPLTAAILLVGGTVGGYAGGRLTMVLPAKAFRSMVISGAIVLASISTYRYWSS